LARLDRLGPAKEIAQIAATIGREFDLDLLGEATGRSRADLRTQLAHLVRSGLIVEIDEVADRPRFSFKHALLQQAAESTILRERRQQLHAVVANALERRDPAAVSAYPELLAQHFANAALHDRAAENWLLAGLKAGKTWAKVEAAGMFARGIAAATRLPDSETRNHLLLRLELEREAMSFTLHLATSPRKEAIHTIERSSSVRSWAIQRRR
jgi:predicted ATPase